MEIHSILIACIVSFQVTLIQSYSQMGRRAVTKKMNEYGQIKENLQHLFDSIASSDNQHSEIYRDVLKKEVGKQQHAFEVAKEEIRTARYKSSSSRRNGYKKNEIRENVPEMKKRQVTQAANDINGTVSQINDTNTSVQGAGYVIFRRLSNRPEFLLLQASYGDFHWSPPKGHVNPGEHKGSQTALREVSEESGLQEVDLKLIAGFEKVLNYEVTGKPKSVTYWLAELKDPNKKITLSGEHKDYKWLPIHEACELGKYAETKDLLMAAYDFLSRNDRSL